MAWTDKMVEDLKIMWKQGLTTGEIGRRLGVSKNSIVGKVHRLQLDARPSPIKRKDEPKTGDLFAPKNTAKETAEKKTKPQIKSAPKTEKTPQAEKKTVANTKDDAVAAKPAKEKTSEEKNIDISNKFFLKQPTINKEFNGNAMLIDLDNHTCRWPLGDPKDENFRFCGRKVRIGQTYCEEHSALAYVKPTKK